MTLQPSIEYIWPILIHSFAFVITQFIKSFLFDINQKQRFLMVITENIEPFTWKRHSDLP